MFDVAADDDDDDGGGVTRFFHGLTISFVFDDDDGVFGLLSCALTGGLTRTLGKLNVEFQLFLSSSRAERLG